MPRAPDRADDTMTSYSSKGPTAIDHIAKPDMVPRPECRGFFASFGGDSGEAESLESPGSYHV